MRNYSYFDTLCAKRVNQNHRLVGFSYIVSKLWDSITSHMAEIGSINEFRDLTCAHADFTSCKAYLQNIGYL